MLNRFPADRAGNERCCRGGAGRVSAPPRQLLNAEAHAVLAVLVRQAAPVCDDSLLFKSGCDFATGMTCVATRIV